MAKTKTKAQTKAQEPDPIDIHVGAKVRAKRLLLGLSQEALASKIGLTFQQVQKYERGTNRISVSRLVDICRALKSPLDSFLDSSLAIGKPMSRGDLNRGFSDNEQESLLMGDGELLAKRDVFELIRAYSKIESPKLKKQILEMAKAMSSDSEDS